MTLDLDIPNGPSMQETVAVAIDDYGRQPALATPASDEVFDLSNITGAAG